MTSRQTSVTHADLAPTRRATASLASKGGVSITIVCVLCGLLCFILCLVAEATRSQVTWEASNDNGEYVCEYGSNGRTPLACAAAAFLGLAAAMVVQHTFLLVAMTNTPPPEYVSWDPASTQTGRVRALTWQAGFFFISTWICFAVAEILLLIGVTVESGHLKKWQEPRSQCLVVKQGVFTAASIFALLTVFLAAGLYTCALRMQWLCEDQDTVRREALQGAAVYVPSSPPRSPTGQLSTSTLPGTKSSLV